MSIRPASPTDLPALSQLFAQYLSFYDVAKSPEQIEQFLSQRLAQQDSVILLAQDEAGNVQGFIQLYSFFASLHLAPAWLLSDLYVQPGARRTGQGRALLLAAREHALATGACGLQLETGRSNYAGQTLYESLGYVRETNFYTYWLGLS
jgi:ribosomal protein S18 acetylase RimI-like enzyme